MQVYKGMDIGTGKITEKEKQHIPHHMLDIKNPDEDFSVVAYQQEVQQLITHINQRHHTPILVGGSGLYIQAVLYDYVFSDQKRDDELTKKLEKRIEDEGNHILYEEDRKSTRLNPVTWPSRMPSS